MSLTAITSRSARSSASRVKARPIRPKPLIPTLVIICFLLTATLDLETAPRAGMTAGAKVPGGRFGGPCPAADGAGMLKANVVHCPNEVRVMGARRRDIRSTPLGRFVRGRRPDRNPLRRGCDRVETAVLALLVIVFLAAAPFAALASGSWALATARQAQLAERTSSFQVPALVLKPEAPSGGWYGDLGAQARWTAQ